MRALAPHALARDVAPPFLHAFIAKKSGDVQDGEGYRPDARLEVIAGAGHLLFLERPEATLRVLGDFLAA